MKRIFLAIGLLASCGANAMESYGPEPMDIGEETVPAQSIFEQLMQATFQNDLKTTRELLQKCEGDLEPESTRWGSDPLNWAAHHGNEQMTELLLQKGFWLVVGPDGSSPIHVAAYHNKPAVLCKLLSAPNLANSQGLSVGQLVERHFAEIIKILTTPTTMQGVELTPCEIVPGPEDQTVCKPYLRVDNVRERLQQAVEAQYNLALIKAALPKKY